MKQIQAIKHATEGLILLIGFLTSLYCVSSGILIRDGHLTHFWTIPIVFFGVGMLIGKCHEDGMKIPWWVSFLYTKLAAGTWMGLSFGAVLILNDWYDNPNDGKLEPLFTAAGLSSAGVLAAETWCERTFHKDNEIDGATPEKTN